MPDLYSQLSQLGQTAGSIQTPGYLAQIEGLKTKSALDTAELQRRNIEQSMEQTRLENERIARQEELQKQYKTELKLAKDNVSASQVALKYGNVQDAKGFMEYENEMKKFKIGEYDNAIKQYSDLHSKGLINDNTVNFLQKAHPESWGSIPKEDILNSAAKNPDYTVSGDNIIVHKKNPDGTIISGVYDKRIGDNDKISKQIKFTDTDGKEKMGYWWGGNNYTDVVEINKEKGKGMYVIAKNILIEQGVPNPSENLIYQKMNELDLLKKGKEQEQKQDIELDKPLKGYEVKNYFDPNTLAPVKGGITMREIEKMGAIKIDTQDRDKLLEIPKTEAIIKELDEVSKELMTATDAASAYSQAVKIKAGRLSKQTLPVGYEAIKSEFIGNLSRSLGGERGVLTDGDIKRIEKGLPADGDTKAIRDFKMLAIYTILQSAKEVERTKVFGLNPNKKEEIKMDTLLKALGSGDETKITNALNSLKINNQEQPKENPYSKMTDEEIKAELEK